MARTTMAQLQQQLADTKRRNRELKAERERLVATVSAGMLLTRSLLEALEGADEWRDELNAWIAVHSGQPPQ